MADVENVGNILSHTFILRKEVPGLNFIISGAQDLLEHGFKLQINFSADNNRRIELNFYERSIQHPTLKICRMLKSSPDKATKIAVSMANFSNAFRAPIRFSVGTELSSFTMTILEPSSKSDLLAIMNNLQLLSS